jgi:hypothetical protein
MAHDDLQQAFVCLDTVCTVFLFKNRALCGHMLPVSMLKPASAPPKPPRDLLVVALDRVLTLTGLTEDVIRQLVTVLPSVLTIEWALPCVGLAPEVDLYAPKNASTPEVSLLPRCDLLHCHSISQYSADPGPVFSWCCD